MIIVVLLLFWVGFIYILNSYSSHQVTRWAYALTFELFALFALIFWRLCSYFWFEQKPKAGSKPILLVHGYLDGPAVWTLMKARLEKEGFGPIYTIDLGHPFQSLRDYAKKVEAKVKQIEQEVGKSDITLIGHSMGGLVCSLYATAKAGPSKIIAIGSPFGGTMVARLGIGRSAKEMRIGSSLLKELQEALDKRPDIELYHIATKTDALIIPYTSALKGSKAESRLILEDVGHVGLAFSGRVARYLSEIA